MKRYYSLISTALIVVMLMVSCSKEKDAKDTERDLIDNMLAKYGDTCFVEHDGIYLYLIEQGNYEYSSGDIVEMTYTGQCLEDNFTFAKEKVISFEYGNSGLIKGIDMALPYIKQGSKGYLLVPFKYGYGNRRVGQIEPYSTLLFTFVMQ